LRSEQLFFVSVAALLLSGEKLNLVLTLLLECVNLFLVVPTSFFLSFFVFDFCRTVTQGKNVASIPQKPQVRSAGLFSIPKHRNLCLTHQDN
jgi:hypothetical protein